MEEKIVKRNKYFNFFVVISIILIIVVAYFIYKINNENVIKTAEITNLNNEVFALQKAVSEMQETINSISSSKNKDNDIKNTIDEKIKQFLTNVKIISTDSSVDAGYPEMYYFTSDGKFAYMNVPYFTKEGQTISFVGTWEIKDNNLILNIQQEKKVKGGKMVEAFASDPYDHLEDYTEEISKESYTKKYKIIDLINDKERRYDYYYIKLDNIELYPLYVNEEDVVVKDLKSLALNGSY